MTPAPTYVDGLVRLASVAFRKYAGGKADRASAARLLMTSAIRLYAAETTPGDAALGAGEVIGELSVSQRRSDKAQRVASASGERV